MNYHFDNLQKKAPVLCDPFGRQITYLRLSVTDRCNLRCVYCMAEKMQFVPKKELLSLEEMLQISQAFTELGVNKIRLTGGEPLVRENITWLTKHLAALPGLNEVTMTTNGILLKKYAADLQKSGVKRINISLDSLREDRFKSITRIGSCKDVINGIIEAKKQGFKAIKLNSVIMRGQNDDEILDLVDFAVQQEVDISFIEEMPLGAISSHDRSDTLLLSDHIKQEIQTKYSLIADTYHTGGPSKYMRIQNTNSRVGFISPHSNNFCSTCNRVRLTAEGKLLLCLGHENSVDLRAVLRSDDYSQEKLQQTIVEAISRKPKQHEFDPNETHVIRFMNMTGG